MTTLISLQKPNFGLIFLLLIGTILALVVIASPGPVGATNAPIGDADEDLVDDSHDNCLGIANPLQLDVDDDGRGDACDPDADDSLGTAIPISLGGSVDTDIFEGDTDIFSFTIPAGESVMIAPRIVGETEIKYLALLDSGGSIILEDDDLEICQSFNGNLDSSCLITIVEGGKKNGSTYYLEVASTFFAGFPSGPYTLELLVGVPNGGTHSEVGINDSITTPDSMTLGDDYKGKITPGDIDIVKFSPVVGAQIGIVKAPGGSLFDTTSFLDPKGVPINFCSPFEDFCPPVEITASGKHFFLVTNLNGFPVGPYLYQVQVLVLIGDLPEPTLTVTKIVVNDGGGTAAVGDFPLFIDGAPVTSGVAEVVTVGDHTVSETGMAGYSGTIGGDCDPDGTITLALGEALECTITNDYIAPPTLTVIKIVVNDDGGTAAVGDFPLFIDSVPVTSGDVEVVTVGDHTVSETGMAGYSGTIGGDCEPDGTITLASGDVATCTITNDDIAVYGSGSPKEMKERAAADLAGLVGSDKHSQKVLDKAVKHLGKSLNPDWWVDDDTLVVKKGKQVFDEEKKAVKGLKKIIKDKGKASDPAIADAVGDVVAALVEADQLLARSAIEDAEAAAIANAPVGDKVAKEIAKAEEEMLNALDELGKGRPDKAIDKYKRAWDHAQKAINHANK